MSDPLSAEAVAAHQRWVMDSSTGARLELVDVDLSGRDLRRLKLTAASFRACRLGGAVLDGTWLGQAHLEHCDLTGASLVGTELPDSVIEDCIFDGADLRHADLTNAHIDGSWRKAVLTGANLTAAQWFEADLSGADLRRARLVQATLHDEVRLEGADLVGADLREAWIATPSIAQARLLGRQRLPASERVDGYLREAIESDAPAFARHLATPVAFERIDQPWLQLAEVREVLSETAHPPTSLHVARIGDRVWVLTGHPEHLDEVRRISPPVALSHAPLVQQYLLCADAWTTTAPQGELLLTRFGDIPFHQELGSVEKQLVDALRTTVGPRIRAPELEQSAGTWTLTRWLVGSAGLIRRTLILAPGAAFARKDEVVHRRLPCPA